MLAVAAHVHNEPRIVRKLFAIPDGLITVQYTELYGTESGGASVKLRHNATYPLLASAHTPAEKRGGLFPAIKTK